MIALIQRVSKAHIDVNDHTIAQIKQGIVALIGVEKSDNTTHADKLLHKLLNYRIFSDQDDKMNLSVQDINGGLLLIPQFTLAANTNKGLRPSFSSAKTPSEAEILFQYLLNQAKSNYTFVATGEFGANMQVSLVNDGPVTFSLSVS